MSHLSSLLFLLFVTSLAAAETAVPDFSEGIPNVTVDKIAKVGSQETFHLKTALSSKEFLGTLRRFLGAGWTNRKLNQAEMTLAARKGRMMNAEIGLTVHVNAKLPGVEIRVIHFKPKQANTGNTVEVAVFRPAPTPQKGAGNPADDVETTVELQRMTALSSMQFYTYFALVRNMLEATWDDDLFKQFSLYDGMNLQMMQRLEEKLQGDKKWGQFLRIKNALHQKVHDDLEPLILKKRENQNLSANDTEKLKALDKLILEKLIK